MLSRGGGAGGGVQLQGRASLGGLGAEGSSGGAGRAARRACRGRRAGAAGTRCIRNSFVEQGIRWGGGAQKRGTCWPREGRHGAFVQGEQ